jgi:membrane-associated phospholipid phosphatase
MDSKYSSCCPMHKTAAPNMRHSILVVGFLILLAGIPQAEPQSLAGDSTGPQPPDARPDNMLPEDPSQAIPIRNAGRWNTLDGQVRATPGPMSSGVSLVERFAGDQRAIWSSPLHLGRGDAAWALPALAGAGALLASDSWLARQVPAGGVARSRTLSDYGAFSLAGAAGGMLIWGKIAGNDHAAETGFLASEAAVNAAAVDFALKSIFQRKRPYVRTGAGRFFSGGSSFPSEHSAVSWAIAGVVAHEYPGTVTKLLSYGLASAVTVARVTGKEHFPSDVVVGAALGYFIARQIYQRQRDPEVSEGAWESLVEKSPPEHDKMRSPRNMGSSYVPPDSWIYPLFERLAAMGYIHSAYLGIRPWTRLQCARFLEEAGDSLRYKGGGGLDGTDTAKRSSSREAQELFRTLSREFDEDTERLEGAANVGIRLDSIYERTTNLAGQPLTDGYHFAQTLINDYGRPYGRGFNAIAGVAGHADAGMLSFSFQGEYQHAPALPSYSTDVQQAISQTDQVPPFANGTATIDRLQVIGSSVGLTYHDLQFSFGKQAEWLGPGDSGPFLASTNAPSILMFQVANVVPYSVPLLGPAQSVFFVGQLTGQNFVYNPPNILGPGFHPQPFIHGNKMSFKPTSNLEFGMGVTAIFGGPGLPFTWSEFFRSYYSHKLSISQNPAKRFSGFDFSYRVPGLRKWLTVYNDSLVGDEISPIGSDRPMLSPGLYLPQVPRIPKLELRFEGVKDPFTSEFLPGFVYYDRRYRSGYTNGGNLIGSWVGRDGFGAQAQASYWFSPRTKLQLGYRYQEADRSFLQGGRLADYSLRAETRLKSGIAFSGFVQYEQWMFPLLSASRQANVTSSLQVSFFPHRQAAH